MLACDEVILAQDDGEDDGQLIPAEHLVGRKGRTGPRAKTLASPRQFPGADEPEADGSELAELEALRPRTRADCANVPRPCPFVLCKFNLFLDVSEATGNVKFNFPGRDVADVDPRNSCLLDVADRGGLTLDEVGALMNLTRERVRQIELTFMRKLRANRSLKECNEDG